MKPDELDLIRERDHVLLRGRVVSRGVFSRGAGERRVAVEFEGDGGHYILTADAIVSHEPAEFDVGDDVVAPDGNGHGVVVATADDKAWVRFAPTIFGTYRAADLRRAVIG